MSLRIPVVWSADCLRHEPAGEVWLGVREPGTEVPDRAAGAPGRARSGGRPGAADASPHDDAMLRTVHSPELLDHLATHLGGLGGRPGYAATTAGTGWCRTCSRPPRCWPGCRSRAPPAAHARAGLFCYDTMTLVGPGSWEAIRGAPRTPR